MVFKVNGTDILPYAMVGGISWKRVNVEGGNGMIMADGTERKDRIAARYEWTFNFRPMTAAEQATLLTLLNPRTVTVEYTDPQTNSTDTAYYYVSDVPAGYLVKRTGGTEYWGGMSATFTAQPGRAPA